MRFEFASATRIIFGNGAVGEAGAIAKKMGRRASSMKGNPVELNREELLAILRKAIWPIGRFI